MIIGTGDATNPQFSSQVVTDSATTMQKSHLISLRKCISAWDLALRNVVMNPARIDDMLGWAQNDVDQLTQREMLESGVKYQLWGSVNIITSILIPVNDIFGFADPEFVGRMPILQDLTIALTERPNKLETGLFMYEFLGFYVASQKAVAKLRLGYSSGAKMSSYSNVGDNMARSTTVATVGSTSLNG